MLSAAVTVAFALFGIALLLNAWRLLRGPDATDRILALDTLYINTIALVVLLGIHWASNLSMTMTTGRSTNRGVK